MLQSLSQDNHATLRMVAELLSKVCTYVYTEDCDVMTVASDSAIESCVYVCVCVCVCVCEGL